jgi:hypothetical protein
LFVSQVAIFAKQENFLFIGTEIVKSLTKVSDLLATLALCGWVGGTGL